MKTIVTIKRAMLKIPFIRSAVERNKKTKIVKAFADGRLLDLVSVKDRKHWSERIEILKHSSDNENIVTVSDAGCLNSDNHLIMHNGLVIDPLSYYGIPMLELLRLNKGIHEPQEEYAFQEVLKSIPEKGVMIELGSYWSFYSMWFNAKVPEAQNYMIEPSKIEFGQKNFSINGMKGDFTKAFISSSESKNDNKTITVDGFISRKEIEFVDILHSDIQGFELKMLKGASRLLESGNVGYIFISTHSNELHDDCLSLLLDLGYKLVCSCNLDESYSWDGLLVLKNPNYKGIEKINISKRT